MATEQQIRDEFARWNPGVPLQLYLPYLMSLEPPQYILDELARMNPDNAVSIYMPFFNSVIEDLVIGANVPPHITSVEPYFGYAGQEISIYGDHFTGVTDVTVQGVSAVGELINDGHITILVPADLTPDVTSIVVFTPNGSDSIEFTVTAVPEPAYATMTTALAGDNNDIIYTAVDIGTSGNAITVQYLKTVPEESPEIVDAAVRAFLTDHAIVVTYNDEIHPIISDTITATIAGDDNDLIWTAGYTFPGAALSDGGYDLQYIYNAGADPHSIVFGGADLHATVTFGPDSIAQDILDTLTGNPDLAQFYTAELAPGNDGTGLLGVADSAVFPWADGSDGFATPVITADDVITAITSDPGSNALVTVSAVGGDGSGVITDMAPTPLADGVGASPDPVQAVATVSFMEPNSGLVFIADTPGAAGNEITIEYSREVLDLLQPTPTSYIGIEDAETADGWTWEDHGGDRSGPMNLSAPEDAHNGSHAVTINGIDGPDAIVKKIFADPIDFSSADGVGFWYRMNSAAESGRHLYKVQFGAGDTSLGTPATDYFEFVFPVDLRPDGVWQYIMVARADCDTIGTPDWSAIDWMVWNVANNGFGNMLIDNMDLYTGITGNTMPTNASVDDVAITVNLGGTYPNDMSATADDVNEAVTGSAAAALVNVSDQEGSDGTGAVDTTMIAHLEGGTG